VVQAAKQKVLSEGLSDEAFFEALIELIDEKRVTAKGVFDTQPRSDTDYRISHGKVLVVIEIIADLKRLQGEAANANADDGVVR